MPSKISGVIKLVVGGKVYTKKRYLTKYQRDYIIKHWRSIFAAFDIIIVPQINHPTKN